MNFSELLAKYFQQLTISWVLIFLYIFYSKYPILFESIFLSSSFDSASPIKKLINDIKHTSLVFQINNAGPILSL